jgi:GTP-binding protein Era
MSDMVSTRCGRIVLAGRPNAGKSTLLNALVETKLSIVSAKPQATRQSVIGVRTDDDTQLIFVDPPGLLDPQYLLQAAMADEAENALRGADAVLYLHRVIEGPPPPLISLVPSSLVDGKPVATVLTFADRIPANKRSSGDPDTVFVGTPKGLGLQMVLRWCRDHVSRAPFQFATDDVSTQPVRFFAAEFVRQAAFDCLHEELPYAVATAVDEFREGSDPLYIRVAIYVERESQKGMVIGQGGRTVKRIGRLARKDIEQLLGQHVFLELRVKVLPRWRKSANLLRQLGFTPPIPRSS